MHKLSELWVTVVSLRQSASPHYFDRATYQQALWRVAANKVPSAIVWLVEQKDPPPFDALAARVATAVDIRAKVRYAAAARRRFRR